MPIKPKLKETTSQAYKHLSFEQLAKAYFMFGCWEVLTPEIDHGKKTDLVVCSPDDVFYRIQIKTLNTIDESIEVENKWSEAKIDYVIYFSLISNWGYIVPPFSEKKKKLNASGHIRFHQHQKPFLEAFSKI